MTIMYLSLAEMLRHSASTEKWDDKQNPGIKI